MFWLSIVLYLTTLIYECHSGGLGDFMKHSGSTGTQHGRDTNDTKFYSSNSEVPHLPFVTGFVGTHGTYRFLTINEQTALILGEAKHGLWRIQENGLIREYRRKGKVGLRDGVNPNSKNLDRNTMDIIKHNYGHFLPGEGSGGYRYPDQRISDGSYDGMKDYVEYIDLTIYHPKYGGKYNDHVAIDLNNFYCTLSGPDYPHLMNAWKYALAQPMANRIGPLGRRAGLDIKETHFNALRLNFFDDANIWVNIQSAFRFKTLSDLKSKVLKLNFQRLDLSKMDYEVYLVERPFYNKKYIFVAFVMERKSPLSSQFSYIRSQGPYWDELKARINTSGLETTENHFPTVPIKDFPGKGQTTQQRIQGLPVYGIHHMNRPRFGLTGGFCPMRGGDFGRYPWGNSGAGFPNNYEEVGPLCDGVLIDMKFWANLWSETWSDPQLLLGNAGFDGKYVISYIGDGNVYGRYTDPYLNNRENPYLMDLTWDGKIVQYNDKSKQPGALSLKMNFTRLGTLLKFNKADIKPIDLPDCPGTTPKPCPTTTTEAKPTSSTKSTVKTTDQSSSGAKDPTQQGSPTNTKDDGPFEGWELTIMMLLIFSIILNIVIILLASNRTSNLSPMREKPVRGYDNPVTMTTIT